MLETSAVLFLMKLLPVFAYPLGAAILLLIVSVACIALKLWRNALFSMGAAFSLLWVCSMPVFAAWALGTLERQFPARAIAETPECLQHVVFLFRAPARAAAFRPSAARDEWR